MGLLFVFDKGCPLVDIAFHIPRVPAIAGLCSFLDLFDLESIWLFEAKGLELERVGLVGDLNTVAHLFI